jgi:D-serine deaminase-like pyridoxal phosphate-dependent protein
MQRRTFLLTALAASVAATIALKPRRFGEPHNDYFAPINEQLKLKSQSKPMLIIDLDALDENINSLKKLINQDSEYRVVVKSLPSVELLKYVMDSAGTSRLMVFHQPFMNLVAEEMPNADVLLGKPMPIGAARHFYKSFNANGQNGSRLFKPDQQLQWLIDSYSRLQQYLELAKQNGVLMQINIEIDVGLHRGGLMAASELDDLLDLINENPQHLRFTGFMGYDPHVVKLPSFVKKREIAHKESQATYQAFIDRAIGHSSQIELDSLCLNGAGSPTLALHKESSVCNDISAGSGLVKPTDFDIDTLESMQAATYIATPILKKLVGTTVPGLEHLSRIIPWWNPNREHTFFMYGGAWMAEYESPKGLVVNETLGKSTNQQVINGSVDLALNVDDFVFLRPNQSESVFLQFGAIQTVRDGLLAAKWPVFNE